MQVDHDDYTKYTSEQGIQTITFVAADTATKIVSNPLVEAYKNNTDGQDHKTDNK